MATVSTYLNFPRNTGSSLHVLQIGLQYGIRMMHQKKIILHHVVEWLAVLLRP